MEGENQAPSEVLRLKRGDKELGEGRWIKYYKDLLLEQAKPISGTRLLGRAHCQSKRCVVDFCEKKSFDDEDMHIVLYK